MLENKKGQARGSIIAGLFIVSLTIIFMAALLPAIVDSLKTSKASNSLNCAGYVDTSNPSLSYNSSLPTNSIGCTGVNMTPGILVLGVIFAGVMLIMYGGRPSDGYDNQGY